MTNLGIRSIPTWYHEIRFASTLEADWAATFDEWGWYWEYEPEAFRLGSGTQYRPDFHLPAQKVWCEVKGPHNQRIGKAAELQEEPFAETGDEWQFGSYLVAVLRPPGPGDTAQWEGALPRQELMLLDCAECDHRVWMDYAGVWSCRLHLTTNWQKKNRPWLPGGALYRPGDVRFARAPRPSRKGRA